MSRVFDFRRLSNDLFVIQPEEVVEGFSDSRRLELAQREYEPFLRRVESLGKKLTRAKLDLHEQRLNNCVSCFYTLPCAASEWICDPDARIVITVADYNRWVELEFNSYDKAGISLPLPYCEHPHGKEAAEAIKLAVNSSGVMGARFFRYCKKRKNQNEEGIRICHNWRDARPRSWLGDNCDSSILALWGPPRPSPIKTADAAEAICHIVKIATDYLEKVHF